MAACKSRTNFIIAIITILSLQVFALVYVSLYFAMPNNLHFEEDIQYLHENNENMDVTSHTKYFIISLNIGSIYGSSSQLLIIVMLKNMDIIIKYLIKNQYIKLSKENK